MARPHKGQHKIPRIYLQAFANSKGLVWVADENLKISLQKPKNILREKDYYTVKFPRGGGTLSIETRYLNGIEGSYADIYRQKIERHRRVNDEEKAKLAIFVASMMQRQPMVRESFKRFFKEAEELIIHLRGLPDKAKKQIASLPISSSPESIPADDLLKMGEDVGSLHSSLIPDSVPELAPFIFDMRWSFVVRPKDSEPFITADNPCVMVNPKTEAELGRGKLGSQPGLVQKDVELTLPLSSDVALLCGYILEKDCEYMLTDKQTVEEINRRTRRHARTVVGSNKEMLERIVDRAKNHSKN